MCTILVPIGEDDFREEAFPSVLGRSHDGIVKRKWVQVHTHTWKLHLALLLFFNLIGQDLGSIIVDCYRTEELCNGIRSTMTLQECCVETDGIAFQQEGMELCSRCIGKPAA